MDPDPLIRIVGSDSSGSTWGGYLQRARRVPGLSVVLVIHPRTKIVLSSGMDQDQAVSMIFARKSMGRSMSDCSPSPRTNDSPLAQVWIKIKL